MSIGRTFTPGRTAAIIFVLYLIIGLLIADDYGVSIDEPMERTTSHAAYVYVLGDVMRGSEYEAVRKAAENAPVFLEYQDRFYGTALQSVTVLIEHIHHFEMSDRDIILMRHIFVFLNFFASGIFFFLILRRRFGNGWIPTIGVLFYILFPRFFAEAFYNIKDLLFFSWLVIAAYFALRWLEDKRLRFLLLSAFTLAVATNTRILGLSLLLLVCIFAIIQTCIRQKAGLQVIVIKPLLLVVITYAFYVAITPYLWGSPIYRSVETFRHFLYGLPWDETHLYLGEMISRNVPWHYIPVWMSVTIPLLYIVLFLAGVVFLCICITRRLKKKSAGPHTFDLFFAALFFCTLFGYIGLHISCYDGWRHAYGIFFPFLYLAVFGLDRLNAHTRERRKVVRLTFVLAVTICIAYQFLWMVKNHPYEYVYFNWIGKHAAEENLPLDYWGVSHLDLIRYALDHDDRPQLLIDISGWGWKNEYLMNEEEKDRIFWVNTDITPADYFIKDTRTKPADRMPPPGFEEYYSIKAGGTTIAYLYKRIGTPAEYDASAWDGLLTSASSAGSDTSALHDGDYHTSWTTGAPQQPGDYILLEFQEAVDYDYFLIVTSLYAKDFSRALTISTSVDGKQWTEKPYKTTYSLDEKPTPYRYIKFENESTDASPWSVYEMAFGYSK